MRAPILALILASSLAIILTLVGVVMLRGGGTAGPAGALPEETLLAVHVPRPDDLASSLESLASEDALDQGVWEQAARLLEREAERLGIATALTGDDAKQLLNRDLLIALLPGRPEEPRTATVLCARTGAASAAAWDRLLSRLHDAARAAGAVVTTRRHRGQDFLRIRGPAARTPLCVAMRGGVVIATDSAEAMRRCLDAAGNRARALDDLPAYRRVSGRRGRGDAPEAFIWSSGAGLAWLGHRLAAPGESRGTWERAARLLELDALGGLGIELRIGDAVARERVIMILPAESDGLLRRLFTGAPRLRQADSAGAGPERLAWHVGLSVARLDPLYDALPDILALAEGTPRRELRERLEGLEDFLAADPRTALLPAFGARLSLSIGTDEAESGAGAGQRLMSLPMVARLALRHREPIAHALGRLDGLARASGGRRSEVSLEGVTLTGFEFPFQRPFEAAWCITSRELLAGTSSELIAEAIRSGPVKLPRLDHDPEAHVRFHGRSGRLLRLLAGDRMEAGGGIGGLLAAIRARARDALLPPTQIAARMTDEGLVINWAAPFSASLISLMRALDAVPARSGPPFALSDPEAVNRWRDDLPPACAFWQQGK